MPPPSRREGGGEHDSPPVTQHPPGLPSPSRPGGRRYTSKKMKGRLGPWRPRPNREGPERPPAQSAVAAPGPGLGPTPPPGRQQEGRLSAAGRRRRPGARGSSGGRARGGGARAWEDKAPGVCGPRRAAQRTSRGCTRPSRRGAEKGGGSRSCRAPSSPTLAGPAPSSRGGVWGRGAPHDTPPPALGATPLPSLAQTPPPPPPPSPRPPLRARSGWGAVRGSCAPAARCAVRAAADPLQPACLPDAAGETLSAPRLPWAGTPAPPALCRRSPFLQPGSPRVWTWRGPLRPRPGTAPTWGRGCPARPPRRWRGRLRPPWRPPRSPGSRTV